MPRPSSAIGEKEHDRTRNKTFFFLFFLTTLFLFFSVSLSAFGLGGVLFLFRGPDYLFTGRILPCYAPIITVSCPSHFLSAPEMATDQEAGVALKVQGNKAFGEHDWPAAVAFYDQAIEKYDQDPSFFSNRAQVCS